MRLRQADRLGAADTIIVCPISFLTIRNINYRRLQQASSVRFVRRKTKTKN